MVDGQKGVSITLDYQVIDVDSCEAIPDAYVEIWHCNSTGVYSGVVANGNGDSSDASNINQTFLRGIQKTDADGVAQFETLFPGHYRGRATHIHIMVHTNVTELGNSTLGGDTYASHVGQTFFDQDLISAVELLSPYSTNRQQLTTNSADSIFSEEANGVDPVMAYTLLGDNISDGLFAWLAFGINTTYANQVKAAAHRTGSGGVDTGTSNGNDNSQGETFPARSQTQSTAITDRNSSCPSDIYLWRCGVLNCWFLLAFSDVSLVYDLFDVLLELRTLENDEAMAFALMVNGAYVDMRGALRLPRVSHF